MKRASIVTSIVLLTGLVVIGLSLLLNLGKERNLKETLIETHSNSSSSIGRNLATNNEPTEANAKPTQANRSSPAEAVVTQELHPNEPEIALEGGYELTTFHGEMNKVALPHQQDLSRYRKPLHDWITTEIDELSIPKKLAMDSSRDWFFGWIQISPEAMNHDLNTVITVQDFELIAGYTTLRRAKLPRDSQRLATILNHELIVGIGIQPINGKADGEVQESIETPTTTTSIDVFITLMDTQNVQEWQRQLAEFGTDIHSWDASIRVITATVSTEKLAIITSLDFVQAIEKVNMIEASLDSATAGAGADSFRTYTGFSGLFDGQLGQDITIAVMDTGLNLNHDDISTHRTSICGESFIYSNGETDLEDLWIDYRGHGSHVTGIFAGNGYSNSSLAGVAPGVQHIRFAKVLDKQTGSGPTTGIVRAIDYFAKTVSCEWEGNEITQTRPSVINLSLAVNSHDTGNFVSARKVDWAVWSHRQLYVVSQGNLSNIAYSEIASSKNSFSVGNATDMSLPNLGSSWGPTADGRMIPNVTSIGTNIYSAVGDGSRNDYVSRSGTSMSTPLVAGVATLLLHAIPEFRDEPHLARAQLMASAIRPATLLTSYDMLPSTNTDGAGDFTLQHGLGPVSARTTILQNESLGWTSGSAISEITDDEYAYIEIEVVENTSRLDIVLTWDEPANDNVDQAVISDIDLYLGPNEDCDPIVCGEYSSTSRVDNVEYLIIENPTVGTHRISVIPNNIFQHQPRVAVAWKALLNSNTPTLDIKTNDDVVDAKNVKRPTLDLSVELDSYVALGTTIYFSCRAEELANCDYWYDDEAWWQPGSEIRREDGTVQDLAGWSIRDPLLLGELAGGEIQDISLVFPPSAGLGNHQLYMLVSSMNADSDVVGVNVNVDDSTLPSIVSHSDNDSFADAMALEGNSGQIDVELAAASREPVEWTLDGAVALQMYTLVGLPIWGGLYDSVQGYRTPRSTWYTIQSEEPSRISLSISNTVADIHSVLMYVMKPGPMSFLDHTITSATFGDNLEFFVEANQTYYLWLVSYNRMFPPIFTLSWQKFDAIPSNDNFADREVISGESGEVAGNNVFATTEPGEPGAYTALASTWYDWTAPSDTNSDFWNFYIGNSDDNSDFIVLVYEGSSFDNLRLVSDSPSLTDQTPGAVVPIQAGNTYKIAVASWRDSTQGNYRLIWEPGTDRELIENDMYDDAESISGTSGQTSINPRGGSFLSQSSLDQRTVEPDEPSQTNSHSQWWTWTAPSTRTFTWRLTGSVHSTLTLFEGSNLSSLVEVTSGRELTVAATSGTTYSVALHRQDTANYIRNRSAFTIAWGPTPENDSITAASSMVLEGTSGSSSMELEFATTSRDEGPSNGIQANGVKSSVWAQWTAPGSFSSWMKFSLANWGDAGLEDSTDQHFLGIHHWNSETESYDLIASSDRSFVISGRADAQFEPVAGEDYLVQIALRNTYSELNSSQKEVSFTWDIVAAPPWLVNTNDRFEYGDTEGEDIPELIDPITLLTVGRTGDHLLLRVEEGLLVLGSSAERQEIEVVEMITGGGTGSDSLSSVVTPTQSWNIARQAIYFARNTNVGLFEGFDQSSRYFGSCTIADDYDVEPTQVISHPNGRFLDKVGLGTIAVYRLDGPCEVTLVEVLSSTTSSSHSLLTTESQLAGLRQVVMDPTGGFLYGISTDYLLPFTIDNADGTLTLEDPIGNTTWLNDAGVPTDRHSHFTTAALIIDPSNRFMFAIGTNNPSVALFEIASDRVSPKVLAARYTYYMNASNFFPSHIRKPRGRGDWWNVGNCELATSHSMNHVSVDVFCRGRYFVMTWDENEEELYISDWSSNQQADRFGNPLPDFSNLEDSLISQSGDHGSVYVVVEDWIDSITQFERVSGESTPTADPIAPYDEYIVRLVALEVDTNEIKIGSKTITACEAIADTEVDGVTYTVESSKWQSRTEAGGDWTDVASTVRSDNQLCPYDPDNTLDHRLVMDIIIDSDPSSKYSSEIFSETE